MGSVVDTQWLLGPTANGAENGEKIMFFSENGEKRGFWGYGDIPLDPPVNRLQSAGTNRHGGSVRNGRIQDT